MPDIDLSSFIGSVLEGIKDGASEEFTIQGPIEFELSTITTKSKDGKVDVKVLELGAEVNIQDIQKIKFQVFSKSDLGLKKTAADIRFTTEENSRRWSVGYKPGPVK